MIERLLRKAIPSVSLLSYNPVFKIIVNTLESPVRWLNSSSRTLPPNHLRIRVGVGNRILGNRGIYLTVGKEFWSTAFTEYGMKMDWTVVDLGCGCGRLAHIVRDLADGDGTPLFCGQYIGVDVDQEAIGWCRDNFDQRFSFLVSTDGSSSYNKDHVGHLYKIPEADGSVDMVFSTSLFSHLLDDAASHYIKESARLLKRNGVMHHSFFSLDFPPNTLGHRHHFANRLGNANVESLRQPEAAVAYHNAFLRGVAEAAGLVDITFEAPSWIQATMVARKG